MGGMEMEGYNNSHRYIDPSFTVAVLFLEMEAIK